MDEQKQRSVEDYRAELDRVAERTREEFLSPEGFADAEALYAKHLEDNKPLFPIEAAAADPGLDENGDPLVGDDDDDDESGAADG